jgi:hypothetical protein
MQPAQASAKNARNACGFQKSSTYAVPPRRESGAVTEHVIMDQRQHHRMLSMWSDNPGLEPNRGPLGSTVGTDHFALAGMVTVRTGRVIIPAPATSAARYIGHEGSSAHRRPSGGSSTGTRPAS